MRAMLGASNIRRPDVVGSRSEEPTQACERLVGRGQVAGGELEGVLHSLVQS